MTQEVKVPVAELPRVLRRSVREPEVKTEEKILEVRQVQTIECIVEVLQIQCQDVIRHVTAPQIQEVVRQVTVFSRWCSRLMSDPTECVFVDSDTRYGWNPSTMLLGTAFYRPISQTHVSRSTSKDCSTGAQIQSTASQRRQASWPVWSGRTVMSMTSGRTRRVVVDV